MMIYEKPGDRFMVMLSAGNLSISQSVREILQVEKLPNGDQEPIAIWNATSMFDAVRVLGSAVRRVYEEDAAAMKASGIDFNASMIFGGQIGNEPMRMFLVYRAGALKSDEMVCIDEQNPYFRMIHTTWGERLRDVIVGIEDPRWDGGEAEHRLITASERFEPMRKISQPGERIV